MSNPDSELLWQQFLQSIYDDNTNEDEEEEEEVNDPEYSITEDLLKLEDDWDFSDERAFKVSDYELDLLLDEDDNEMEVQTVQTAIESTDKSDVDYVFDENSIKTLVSQLSQHIQLLTQTYFQSFNTNESQSLAQNSISMINELNDISKTNPLFSRIDVKSSVELIGRHPINKSSQITRSMTSWRTLPVTKENQRIYISNPNVFRESWLLPVCGFCCKQINKNKRKASFTLAEDHLIALGLEQFSPLFSLRKCYRYLKQLLLPNKTVDQIRTHIKNIKRRSNANESQENPIIYFYSNGKAPDLNFDDNSSKDKNPPEWYIKAIKTKSWRKDNHNLSSDPKKLKTGNVVTNDRKRGHPILVPLQSPVKQTNSIVKKYKYLNRLNQIKQNISVASNTNSRTKKCSNKTNLNQIQAINSSEIDPKSQPKSSEQLKTSEYTSDQINAQEVFNECQQNQQNFDKCIDSNGLNQTTDDCNRSSMNEIVINEEDVDFDDESDLAALMTASSTITSKNKIKSKTTNDSNNCSVLQLNLNKKEGRKSLAVKQRESTLQLLSFEDNENHLNNRIKEEILVQNFLEKVRKSLSHESYVQFLTLLSDFHQKRTKEESLKSGLIKDIYLDIEMFLRKSNVSKEIISEFVLFLSAEQAEQCGKMFEYLYWKRVFNFVTKLEKYSQIDGQCLSRFYRSLNQLKANYERCDANQIQWTVNRSLNGHSYLMHHFSSLLMNSKPSEYLFEDKDFDEIVVDSSDDEEKTDSSEKMFFETINIPESDYDLKFGTNECPCSTCHNQTSNQTITTHCTSCSIRFIGGRVYLTQNHKKLCSAEIHFTESDHNFESKFNENIEEDIGIESDKEVDIETQQLSDKSRDKKSWTITDDKMLLELCRSKVLDEKHNDLSEDVFQEVAIKLSKDTTEVITRFHTLMELFACEQESHLNTN